MNLHILQCNRIGHPYILKLVDFVQFFQNTPFKWFIHKHDDRVFFAKLLSQAPISLIRLVFILHLENVLPFRQHTLFQLFEINLMCILFCDDDSSVFITLIFY